MNRLTNLFNKKEGNNSNHKLTAECFSKCTKWKLNMTMTLHKTSTGLIFQGKGLYYKKLHSSILNSFQVIDNISEITKTTMKNLEEKSLNANNNNSDEEYNFSLFKFPLNNSEYNLLMTDGNSKLTENLKNIIFLEFDVNSNNISKDHLKSFREINNDFVEKEIHLVLNGTIHDKQVFKNELRFTLDAKKLIKSIQFRLESYKTEFIEKQKSIQKSNPNFEIKNSKFNFFTQIISQPNMGVEFHKSNFENVENYPTNFNSIVNSNITIGKIFLEIVLPNQLIFENYEVHNHHFDNENSSKYNFDGNLMKSYSNFTNLTQTSFKKESKNSIDIIESSNSTSGKSKNRYKTSTNLASTTNSLSHRNSKKEISIYESLERNLNNSSKLYESIRDENLYYEYSSYTSRDFGYNNNYNKNKYNINGKNKFQNYNDERSLYYPKHNSKKNISNNANYSQYNSYIEKNPTSNIYNSQPIENCTNKFSLLESNVPTNNINNNNNRTKSSSNKSLQVLLEHYEGMCNFIIFAKSCTPYVYKNDTHLIDDIGLCNFFKNFEKASAFGLDVNYILEGEICSANYSPTLSSMEISFTDTLVCEKIISELELIRKDKNEEKLFYDYKTDSSNKDSRNTFGKPKFEYNINENLKLICFDNKIKIEYYETKLPHSRFILSHQLEQIFKNLRSYEFINLSKIDKCSWFCVLWTPFKASKSQFANSAFLVYYQFAYTDTELFYRGYNNYLEIPIIGILPLKFEDSTWLYKITKIYNNQALGFTSNLIDFKMALNDSINNVHDFVFSSTDKSSSDYDFYLKYSL